MALAASRGWFSLFLLLFPARIPSSWTEELRAMYWPVEKNNSLLLPGLGGVRAAGVTDAMSHHPGVLMRAWQDWSFAWGISAAQFTVSSALSKGTEQHQGGRSMDHASQSSLFSMGSSVSKIGIYKALLHNYLSIYWSLSPLLLF